MKALISLSRLLVGSIFIISGLIKANDSIGFAHKLDEYFSEAVFNLPFLQEYSLILAIIVCVAEIVLGLMLILAIKPKATSALLLFFLIFFGFLTFYSAYYNKVTDCGCFGDAIKFTPWQSFAKDMILLVLFIPFLINTKHESLKNQSLTNKIAIGSFVFIALLSFVQFEWNFPILFALIILGLGIFLQIIVKKEWASCLPAVLATVVSLLFVKYTIENLPIKDYRPYKIEASIPAGMTVPDDAPQGITHVFIENVKTGDVKGVEMANIPWDDKNWKYRGDLEPKEIEKGYEPPIHDFSITNNDGEDITESVLLWDKALLVVSYSYEKSDFDGWKKTKEAIRKAQKNDIGVIVLTSSNFDEIRKGLAKEDLFVQFGTTDETTLKTIVRSNPGFIYMEEGVIKGKWHFNNFNNKSIVKK
ncbi:MAG: DoxX family protein [Flavobacteriales bacterium]|jgi:uncharacterized membrane protein YphA (DoxX/SURF4 family)|nr:DoxX family protein [Flavobacteriales bacterium]